MPVVNTPQPEPRQRVDPHDQRRMVRVTRKSNTPTLLAAAACALALTAASRLDHRRNSRVIAQKAKPRVVVIGAGFAGLSAALALSRNPNVGLTVIDMQNHHLFQPLLYQVATAALSPGDIASPIRDIIPVNPHTHVMMAAVTGIDTRSQHVLCDGQTVAYDTLIIATGSRPSYFGHPSWPQFAPGLKTMHDALELRRRILLAFEQASNTSDPAERRRLLTFVLIGGGPTGVEMAGSIAELAREMRHLDNDLRQAHPRVILMDAGDRVLADFPPDLSRSAAAQLRGLAVEIRTGAKVTAMEQGVVHLGNERVEAATIIWAAGNEATPVADWLGVTPAKGGQVEVGRDLRVPGYPNIYVIGDAALARDANGKPLPGLAPVAKQQGAYVAHAILRRSGLKHPGRRPAPFRYQDYGTLATIGRAKAVAEFGPLHLTGLPAWALWAGAHIFFLISFRNRFMVSAQWAFAFMTDQRPGRLIAQPAGVPARVPANHPPVANPG